MSGQLNTIFSWVLCKGSGFSVRLKISVKMLLDGASAISVILWKSFLGGREIAWLSESTRKVKFVEGIYVYSPKNT